MEGKMKEGTYKLGDGWVRVEVRHYPRERFVAREVTGPGGEYVGDKTPEVTPKQWAAMETWL